jgi:hypothetical protein
LNAVKQRLRFRPVVSGINADVVERLVHPEPLRLVDTSAECRLRATRAKALSACGVKTARGGEWTAVQVGAILARLSDRTFEAGAVGIQ